MKGEGDVKISYWAAHLTTVVSVSLVLLLLGIIAFITLSSQREARMLREKLEVSLIMNDTVSDNQAATIVEDLKSRPYVISPGYVSKEEALKAWQEETGDDLISLFGVNPLSPEVYFKVKAEFSSEESLAKIRESLGEMPGVEEVVMPDSEMVDMMNNNVQSLSVILGIVALVMIVISFVLINNTVHLSIYARRFIIHTMQLVGATPQFIRRPFILNNLLAGLMASLLSTGILAISLAAARHAAWHDLAGYISWGLYACVAGGIMICGPLICGLSALISTSRYLDKDYDTLMRA